MDALRQRREPYQSCLEGASEKKVACHTIRLSEDVWVKWCAYKTFMNASSNNETASKLLDMWQQTRKNTSTSNPVSSTPPRISKSSGRWCTVEEPKLLFGDLSEISEGQCSSESDTEVDQKERVGSEESFIDITFEMIEDPNDITYCPSVSEDDTNESDEYDSEAEYDDFKFEISLRQELATDIDTVPIHTVGDNVLPGDTDDSGDDSDSDIDADGIDDESKRDVIAEGKCIAFETEILALASCKVNSKCNRNGCDGSVSISKRYFGSCLQLKWVCSNGHTVTTWNSQPKVKRSRAGNLLLSAAITASGNNYEKIRLFFKFLRIGMLHPSSHVAVQARHVAPVIVGHFETIISENIQKYIGKHIIVTGDARMDSPGHSAQYCTYTIMEYESKDILACEILDKRMANLKSASMEKEGLKRGLTKLLNGGILIDEICTDGSTTIAAMIKKDFPGILHSFDTWHGAKNFGKKLASVAAENKNKDLRPWVSHIINHFWFCSRKANGDEDALLARWRGTLHHVTNVHEWVFGDDAIEPKCEHGPLTAKETEQWLEPGGNAHTALTRVMLDVRFLRTLHRYVNFRHTGELETFHELILMYAAKRFAYVFPVYRARNYLAVLDYEHHKNRPLLVGKDGTARLHRTYSKRNKNWRCYQDKEPKTYTYIHTLFTDILSHYQNSIVPLGSKMELSPSDPRRTKRTLAEADPPDTLTIHKLQKSRFS